MFVFYFFLTTLTSTKPAVAAAFSGSLARADTKKWAGPRSIEEEVEQGR